MSTTTSLYFHFPFCTRKCNYCAFYSVPWVSEAQKDAYLDALKTQALSFGETRPVPSVYFGGGTPTNFGVSRLTDLLCFVREHFSLTPDVEITLEANPADVSPADLQTLRNAGFNRLSIGMQSSDDALLKSLGRRHTFADTRATVEAAREAGFRNLSLDLLFALPGQTLPGLETSVRDALSLCPEHISAYSLQLEEGTAFYQTRETLSFPTEDEEEAQYDALCSLLANAGYRHYEISSFAKEGFRSRHNLRYWDRGDYLGIGAAAHSFWNGKRFSNVPDLKAYLASPLTANDYKKAERIDETEAWEETVMLGLRTDEGIPASLVSSEHISRLVSLGLLAQKGDHVALTERGWRVSNAVIGQLLL